jgi:hypothetical protein
MYYWITVNNTTGAFGTGSASHPQDESLAPEGFSYVDFADPLDATTQDAFANPSRYLVQNGELVAQPYFTLGTTTASGTMTVTATLNNAPSTLPADVKLQIAGNLYTLTLDPTTYKGSQTITTDASATVGTPMIEATATGVITATQPATGAPLKVTSVNSADTLVPANKSDYEGYLFAQFTVPIEVLLQQIVGRVDLLQSWIDTLTTSSVLGAMTAEQQVTIADIRANLQPFTTLSNALGQSLYADIKTSHVQFATLTAQLDTITKNFGY